MEKARFEWEEGKDKENQRKHGVSFTLAQQAFLDPHRVVARDVSHSAGEDRFYCNGPSQRWHHNRPIHLQG